MSKDFMTAREEARTALAMQEELLANREADLVYYREALRTFKNAQSALDNEPEETGKVMDELVLRYTVRVQNLEKSIGAIRVNIADIRRSLANELSLKPAIR